MLDIGEEGTTLRDEGAPRLSETAEARSQGYLRWVKEGQDPLSCDRLGRSTLWSSSQA